MSYNANQLFNFIQGSDISGESAYDIWKRLGNVGTEAEFLEFIRSGPKGEKGDAAHIYGLAVSSSVIKKDANSVLVPSSITFSGYYRVGNDITRNEYAGKFVIQETTDGGAWVTKYESNVNESSKVYVPSSSNVNFIKCTFYSSVAEDAIELDVQSVAILTDGVAGEGGEGTAESPLVAILSNEAHVIATDSEGNGGSFVDCNTTIQVFKGTSDVTSEATYEISEFDGITGSWDLSTYTYTVTDLSVDVSHVDITATYDGVSITKRFAVSKSKSGLSAYEIWLSLGNEGTEEDFLNSLKVSADDLPSNIVYLGDDDGEVVIPDETPLYANNIVDNLESTSSNMVLSANQGRVLNEKIEDIIAGSAESNEELQDIRLDVDGVTHESAGEAVRSQINKLSGEIDTLSTDTQSAIEKAQTDANDYTDQKITDLINGAPTTLDTLKEIADAMDENKDVVEALDAAIGSKADAETVTALTETVNKKAEQSDLEAHINDKIVHITEEEHDKLTNIKTEDITETTSTEMPDSCEGKLFIEEITGSSEQNTYTGKNLIPLPHDYAYPVTNYGVTFTYDEETGYITANGKAASTAANYSVLNVQSRNDTNTPFYLPKGKYRVTCCPVGGSGSTYRVNIGYTTTDNTYGNYVTEYGSGAEFEVTDATRPMQVQIVIQNDYTANNLVFKPMICKLEENIEIPHPYYQAAGELNGITFTENEDGSVTANGTATANTSFIFSHRIDNSLILGPGKYRVTGGPSGGNVNTYRLSIARTSDSGSYEDIAIDWGEGAEFTLTKDTDLYLGLYIKTETTVSDLTCKPVLVKLYDYDDTFEPYVGGIPSPNTDYLQEIKSVKISEIKTHNKNIIDSHDSYSAVRSTMSNLTDSSVTITRNVDSTQGISYHTRIFYFGNLEYGTYTASCKVNASGRISIISRNSVSVTFATVAYSPYSDKELSVTFVVDENNLNDINNNLFVRFDMESLNNGDSITFYDMQLEKGDIKTDFVEPESNSITLSQPIELNGIEVSSSDDYTYEKDGKYYIADTIEKIDGEYKKVQRVRHFIFDGTEEWTISSTGVTGINRLIYRNSAIPSYTDLGFSIWSKVLMCSHMQQCISSDNQPYNGGETIALHNSSQMFQLCSLKYQDVDSWKAFLAEQYANGTPFTVYVITPASIITQLPTVDQIAINNLSTYNEITYLKFNSEIDTVFKAQYGVTNTGCLILQALTQGSSSSLNYEKVDIDFETEY